MTPDQLHRQPVVLLQDRRHILSTDRVGLLLIRHHRLHGKLLKAKIRQMLHILREVQVIMGERAAGIIIELSSAVRKLLEFGNDLVVAALSAPMRAHPVVHLPAPVDAEHHVRHFPIQEFLDLVV